MKEPLEMIEEMHSMISKMRDQISVMDTNIKLLQAKVNSEVFSGFTKPPPHSIPSRAPDIRPPQPQQPQISAVQEPQSTQAYKGTMVQGKILTEDGKPIHGVSVKIMNADKKVIKETTTNRAGMWLAQLRPGKYISKSILDNKPAQFKLFEVVEGQHSQDV